jgi:hypothetical protein
MKSTKRKRRKNKRTNTLAAVIHPIHSYTITARKKFKTFKLGYSLIPGTLAPKVPKSYSFLPTFS